MKMTINCICMICGNSFIGNNTRSKLCSIECKRQRKHQTDLRYRTSELGQETRRRNRKSPITIATRKRYEQTEEFKKSKHERNKIYMQNKKAQELEKVRKLNYYYSKFSKKYGLYNKDAHKITLEEFRILNNTDKCFYCKRHLEENEKTIDHKLPVSKGGDNTLDNLIICCKQCNSGKGDKDYEEYLQLRSKNEADK